MPIVRIDITGPKPAEYRRDLLSSTRKSVVESLGVPDGRVSIRVVETPAENVDVPSCRTDRFTIIEVLMYEGRGEELKRGMAESLRKQLAVAPGIEPSEIMVAIRDASKVDLDVPAGEANL